MKVLVLGHSSGQIGGVSNFLRMMEKKGFSDIELHTFTVGPREGESGQFGRNTRLIKDYLGFTKLMLSDIDLVHVNPSLDKRSFVRTLLFIFICTVFKKKYLIFFRGWDWNAYRYFFKRSGVLPNIAQSMVKKASKIIVLAPEFKEALTDFSHTDKIDVITTMFDGNVMPKSEKKFDSPQILFMSRFLPAKGGKEAIEAFVKIKEKFPQSKLRMAGDGPARAEWQEYAKSFGEKTVGLEFVGYVKDKSKTDILENSNIFLMPTKHPEGMPNALMEAMGAGLIPIVTKAGGTFDAIKYGELGYMLEDTNAETIFYAVSKIMQDPSLSAKQSKQVKNHAWKNFEASVVIKKIADIYRSN